MARIVGTPQRDILLGTPNNDTIPALGGNDLVQAGAGVDTVRGGQGDDLLLGNRDDDILLGGAGNDETIWDNGDGSDVIDGGAGFDQTTVYGDFVANETMAITPGAAGGVLFERTGAGAFTLELTNVEAMEIQEFDGDANLIIDDTELVFINFSGGLGEDALDASAAGASTTIVARGDEGNDILIGGAGEDALLGHSGDDDLQGGGGDDDLIGGVIGEGADTLSGGNGRDFLYGGPGPDELTGGRGRDVFLIEPGDGDDRITDFTSGSDVVALRDFVNEDGDPLTFADLEDVTGTDPDGNVTLDLAPFAPVPAVSNTLTLVGVTDVTAADIALI